MPDRNVVPDGYADLAAAARGELAAVHRAPTREWHQPDGWQTPTTLLMAAERGLARVTPRRSSAQEPIPGIDETEVA